MSPPIRNSFLNTLHNMSRIVAFLGPLSVSLMLVALALGLSLGDLRSAARREREVDDEIVRLAAGWGAPTAIPDAAAPGTSHAGFLDDLRRERAALRATLHWATFHRLFGLAAALAVMLSASVVITYFVGTSRWCREVVEVYALDPRWVANSARLKRRAFPWALAAMLAVVGVSALGAAADPMTHFAQGELLATVHLASALGGIVLVAWSFFVQWQFVGENHAIVCHIMDDVRRIRTERGLPVE